MGIMGQSSANYARDISYFCYEDVARRRVLGAKGKPLWEVINFRLPGTGDNQDFEQPLGECTKKRHKYPLPALREKLPCK